MSITHSLRLLTDDEIISNLHDLLRQSRRVEAPLIAHLGEVQARHLYARYAASSMFCYCTQVLHLSEGEAQLRITVANAAREHHVLLEMLADGRLHLSGIAKLAPVLTPDNRDRLLPRAVHKSKRQIEEIVAELAPRPDAPSVIRKLPEKSVPSPLDTPVEVGVLTPSFPVQGSVEVDTTRAAVRPPVAPPDSASRPGFEALSPARYKIQFTAGPELRDDLERLQALMRSEAPDGDLAVTVGKAVRELRRRLEARRFAQTTSPRRKTRQKDASSRYVPAEVRRFVYRREGGRCCFVDAEGRRCPERHWLEFHHRHPFGRGGGHDPTNVFLVCKAHNQYLAELDYGRQKMSRYRRTGGCPEGRSRGPSSPVDPPR